MTNSTGRHLWQGVNEIVDVALAGSPEFMRLKEVNPDIKGKNHWEIRLPGQAHASSETADEELAIVLAREEVLKRLSIEAIRNAPLLFLQQGLIDFSKTIGLASYRVGFGQPGGHYKPLDTREPLPPLARALRFVPPVLVKAAGAAIRLTYKIGYRLYPMVIFFVLASYVALLLNWLRLRGSRVAGPGPGWPPGVSGVLVFVIAGTLFTGLVVTSLVESELIALERVAITFVCAGVLLWQAKTLLSVFRVPADCSARDAADSAGLYTFLATIYFGSLWFSWQVEANNTRKVLPYLPFLALMLAIALEGWRRALTVPARSAARRGAPAPVGGS